MVNYLFGVEWTDGFRFKLINESMEEAVKGKSQAVSQTEHITAYTVNQHKDSPVPFSVTIVDTPGFGDTRGIERDQKIVSQVKKFFSAGGNKGIDQLDAIGFVIQGPLARLTPSQR